MVVAVGEVNEIRYCWIGAKKCREIKQKSCFTVNYRVYIPTAGKGTRLGWRTKHINKALLKVGDKAAISYSVDVFPKEVEFVIGLGFQGDLVRQYLNVSYPEHKFIFVEVEKFEGVGSGPGFSLLQCKKYLQCPFYYISCDTIIDWENVLHYKNNWVGWAHTDEKDVEKYCTIDIEKSCGIYSVVGYHDKSKNGTSNVFVGVSFINYYKDFWKILSKEKVTVNNEIQVSPAILSVPNMTPLLVEWWDIGSEDGLQEVRQQFKGLQNLDKEDEEIYFVNNFVVKYFYNDNIIKGRVERTKLLGQAVPELLGSTKNFYKYEFIQGKDISTLNDPNEVIVPLLKFSKRHLWKKIELNNTEKLIFKDACRNFYYQKTLVRLDSFYEKTNVVDREDIINSQFIPKVKEIFKQVDWDWISDGYPCVGHGDLNLSNVLLLDNNSFKLIDFRQDFGGLVDKFDAYYDFSKLYCSFLFPRQSANSRHFLITENDWFVETNIKIPENFQKAKEIFEKWIIDEGYDLKKVKVLTGLIFLNMSPLHSDPLDKYLFYFAKYWLYSVLNGKI